MLIGKSGSKLFLIDIAIALMFLWMLILFLYLQLNKNLVKNKDIWKTKILRIEERYAFFRHEGVSWGCVSAKTSKFESRHIKYGVWCHVWFFLLLELHVKKNSKIKYKRTSFCPFLLSPVCPGWPSSPPPASSPVACVVRIASKIVNSHDFTILLPASELNCE